MFSLPFHTERTISIDKPAHEVFALLGDFGAWRSWSPWLCQEPTCPVEIEGKPLSVGHRQAWDGKMIGSGEMTCRELVPGQSLSYDLSFRKPWKSKSKVKFTLEESSGSTKVTWRMDGALPVFLFFLKRMMSALIGADYERGLGMLKELAEKGKVPSKVNPKGEVRQGGFSYLGKKHATSVAEMSQLMQEDFQELTARVDAGDLPKPDFALAIYHKYDLVTKCCEFTSAFAYGDLPSGVAEDLARGAFGDHLALRTDHLGPYRFLGNAWSAAMSWQRADKRKGNKAVPNYEIYESMPGAVAEEEIETRIFVPVK